MNVNRFNLTSLRLYIMIVNAGSLTAGAQMLGISLAAASKRMVELEEHCGNTLLIRTKRGVEMTPAGQGLYYRALDVVAKLEQLANTMEDFQSGTTGQLRLWANTSALAGFLPKLITSYVRENPGVSLELEDALSEESVRALLSGVTELAIIGENTLSQDLETIACDKDHLVLITPMDHPLNPDNTDAPISFEHILDHDIVSLPRSTSLTRRIASEAEKFKRSLKVSIQVRSFDAMCHLVSAGAGIAVLPKLGALPHLQSRQIRLQPISNMDTQRTLLLAKRPDIVLSPPGRAFYNMVIARQLTASANATLLGNESL